ncbi:MAG: SDR family oxidoreductase [Myxococcaceae bacterium]|nr:SDR family oxidoreductase [Myxococcaceae bacterium]
MTRPQRKLSRTLTGKEEVGPVTRVALVTGASRGIGFATAEALSRAGLDLVVTSTMKGGTAEIARRVRDNGRKVLEVVWEASSRSSADALVAAATAGLGRVDVLVNNAGIVVRRPVEKLADDDFDLVLKVNLSGPFYLARRLIPAMVRRGYGRIINVSAISATIGSPKAIGYAASKAGLEALTRSLAEELRGTGVFVAAVSPGTVDTDMVKGSGFDPAMTPDEVAGVIRYLAVQAPDAMRGARVEVFG